MMKTKSTLIVFLLSILLIGGIWFFAFYNNNEMQFTSSSNKISDVSAKITTPTFFGDLSQSVFVGHPVIQIEGEVGVPIRIEDDFDYDTSHPSFQLGIPFSAFYVILYDKNNPIPLAGISTFAAMNSYKIDSYEITNIVRDKGGADDKIITTFTPRETGYYAVMSYILIPIPDKTDYIAFASFPENQILVQPSALFLAFKAKEQLVIDLEGHLDEQISLINTLELTLDEKAQIVSNLKLNIDEQSRIIEELSKTSEEQIVFINKLNLQINEQAELINSLANNLADKAYLVSQLQVENEEQAALISAMKLSFADQAGIISQLDNKILDDAEIIKNLNLNLEDQAAVITELKLTNAEMGELINAMKLTLAEEAELIKNLRLKVEEDAELIVNLKLSLDEEQQLINQLYDTIGEQQTLISELETTKRPSKFSEIFFNFLPITILVMFIMLVIYLFRRKRR